MDEERYRAVLTDLQQVVGATRLNLTNTASVILYGKERGHSPCAKSFY